MDEIKDDASFSATLTTDAQKAYYTNALKTAGTTAVETYKTEAEAARVKSIPEKYEFKFADKTPLHPTEDAVKIADYAKSQGLTAEQGQALVDLIQDRANALTARQLADYDKDVKAWADQVKADKDIGGDKYPQTQANVKRVMDRFAPKDSPFRKLLDDTGYGNHPLLVRFLNDVGKAMAEGGRTLESEGVDPKELTLAEALYGKQSA